MEEQSLKDKIDALNRKLDEDKEVKEKKWKIPFFSRLTKKNVKEGWIQVFQVQDNKNIKVSKAPILDGVYMLDGVPRMAAPKEILMYDGKPAIIQPSWSVKPFSAEDNYEKTVSDNMTVAGYRNLLSIMLSEQIPTQKKMGAMVWVIGIIVLVGAGYYLFKGGLH